MVSYLGEDTTNLFCAHYSLPQLPLYLLSDFLLLVICFPLWKRLCCYLWHKPAPPQIRQELFFQPSWANKTKLFPSSIRLPIISLNCFAYETKVISEKSNRLWWTLQNSRMLSHEERALKMRTQEGQNTVWLWKHKQIHFGFINWVLLFCFASCVFITKRGSSNSYPGGGALTISCLALFLYLVKYSTRLLLLSISL